MDKFTYDKINEYCTEKYQGVLSDSAAVVDQISKMSSYCAKKI